MNLVGLSAIQGRICLTVLSIKKIITFFIIILTLSLMIGCGSVRPSFLPSQTKVQPYSLSPFELTGAFIANEQLYIQYLERGRLAHKMSTFDQIVHVNNQPVTQNFSKISRREWKDLLLASDRVKILPEEHWRNFKKNLEADFLKQQTFFLHANMSGDGDFFDNIKNNHFFGFDYLEKELDRRVELHPFIFMQLKEYLTSRNILSKKILFNVGTENESETLLIYCDLSTEKINILSLASNPDIIKPNVMKRSFFSDTGATAGQITKSMALDMVLRPVSSLQRLTFLLADTSLDNLQRTALTAVKFPSLAGVPIPDISRESFADVSEGMDLEKWEQQLDKMTGKKPSQGHINYLVDGKEFFPRFIESVSDAEKFIYLYFYIFDTDDYAIKIADLLREKSKTAKVKVLYDGSGSLVASWGQSASEPKNYQAPATIGKYLSSDSKVKYRVQGTPWLASDHTKIAVIDRDLAFVGGMNIGREYRYEWHDLMMEVRGPVVNKIRREFDKTWAHQGWFGDLGYLAASLKPEYVAPKGPSSLDSVFSPITENEKFSQENPQLKKEYSIRILRTTPRHSEIYNTQLAAIRNSKQRIYIQNSYITDDAIIYELAKARRRGVDVRVIMSLDTDAGAISRSNLLSANTLLENGIRVYAYPRMSHVKAAIYDGWACLGSANFDHLSLRVNKELNLATSDPGAVEALNNKLFMKDFKDSVELTDKLESRWTDRIVEMLADHM